MRRMFVLSLAVAFVAACNEPAGSSPSGDPAKAATTTAANNTKKNERDRDPTLTPMDQGENEVDRTITQKIRQDVMKDDTFSMNAKNVKIITKDGVVTLRGPVKTDKEKTDIAALAQKAEGVKRVDNQIEIASN